MLEATAAAGGTLLALAIAAGLGLAWLDHRHSQRDTEPAWTTADLQHMPAAQLREPCPLCGGRHCAGCDAPARHISTAVKHVARHDFSEVPPSLLWLAQQVDVTFRGALISSQLVGRHVWRPTDPVQFRLWASRKLGRPIQLGPRKVVHLP